MWSTKNTRTGQTGSLLRLREVWSTGTRYPPSSSPSFIPPLPIESTARLAFLSTGKRNENKEIGFSSIVASSASARRRIESANAVNRLIAEFEQAISSLDLLRERSVAKVGQQIFASILQEARSHEWSIPFTKIWPSGELAWFVVEFRAPSIFQRFSRSSCSFTIDDSWSWGWVFGEEWILRGNFWIEGWSLSSFS